MDAWRFILASLRHYRRIHVAVALGVAVATAVLTGALLVGDSMRGSLRDLTLERLGRTDSVILAGHPFRAALADEVASDPEFKKHFAGAEPAMLLNGTLQAGSGASARRATGVSIVGCVQQFWTLGDGGPEAPLGADEVALTEPIARELGVAAGDSVLVRIPVAGGSPADSILGEKSETSRSRTLKVAAVLPTEGIARFGIAPSQQLPRNAFAALSTVQDLLKLPGRANAILVAAASGRSAVGDEGKRALEKALRPTLEDYGLTFEAVSSPAAVSQISGDQLVLPDEVVKAAEKAYSAGALQPTITYLANTISVGEGNEQRKIPYSTISGVESLPGVGPLVDDKGQPIKLADDEIVLNRWAADDLKAKVGDKVAVTFYEPESTHGKLREHTPPPTFTLRAIAELKTSDGKPTTAADPKLTPELPGVTDQKSISDWDLPFELVEKVRPEDEEYWHEYSTTPKAFVSLATAKRLWASRWGSISLLRLPAGETGAAGANGPEQLARAISPSAMGVMILPVKEQGLAASAGTTPFEALFIGFSFFLIAAAVMLVALLFQLGIEQRASELGTLGALGLGRKLVTRLLAREGLLVAVVGATAGIFGGLVYAWLMVLGLRTWWLAAISTPFLRLHVSLLSLLIGWLVGVAVSWLSIWWSVRRLVRVPVGRLIAGSGRGDFASSVGGALGSASSFDRELKAERRLNAWRWVSWPLGRVILGGFAIVLCAVGFFLHGESQAGSFFGSGAAVLALLLGEIRFRLGGLALQLSERRSLSLSELSALNIARNPGRSTLTIGLVAAASFLIVAVSSFHLKTSDSGTGGFEFVAASDLPIHYDLNSAEGRRELGFSEAAEKDLSGYHVYSLRVEDGENASCLNLYQPKQPRVLGLPETLIDRGGFNFTSSAKVQVRGSDNKWMALYSDLGSDENQRPIVPVVLDAATAAYSLHLGGVGTRFEIVDGAGRPVTLEIVGLLENSVLQGNLLISEQNFLRVFPDAAGYRFFLIAKTGEHQPPAIAQSLESALAEEGFDVRVAREELAELLAVQNTYLSTFQSLGALGLLLGTVGLAVAQLRSVIERRGELALMRAGGFKRRRLVQMVVGENVVLLVGGLAVGCVAAGVALIPQWLPQGASVPWFALVALLGTIAGVGLLAGWLATRSVLRAPVVAALRGD
jgi:ABC-type antimicrobial peptide transport system permease subunit